MIVAPTVGDGVTSCVNGPSGLRNFDPKIKVTQRMDGAIVKFSNGVEARIFGAHTPDDIERLRSGGNRCRAWLEELAAFRYMDEAFQHTRYGLRLGKDPRWVASTTPKPRELIKKLVKVAMTGEVTEELGKIVMAKASTDDNPHLPSHIRSMLYADYGGTRLGRQELYADILDDVVGALWKSWMIEVGRLTDTALIPRQFDIILVSVDPPGREKGEECGITVHGKCYRWKPTSNDPKGLLPHGFLLADRSMQGTPNQWAQAAIDAFDDFGANGVVAEINMGLDMVKNTLRMLRASLPVLEVHASRGKARRAEPVVSLYEQNRYHHCGIFGKAENEMLTWDSTDDTAQDWSPNRMDSVVWGATKLLVTTGQARQTSQTQDRRLRGRR